MYRHRGGAEAKIPPHFPTPHGFQGGGQWPNPAHGCGDPFRLSRHSQVRANQTNRLRWIDHGEAGLEAHPPSDNRHQSRRNDRSSARRSDSVAVADQACIGCGLLPLSLSPHCRPARAEARTSLEANRATQPETGTRHLESQHLEPAD